MWQGKDMTTFGKLQIVLYITLQGKMVRKTLVTVENVTQTEAEHIAKQFKEDNFGLADALAARFIPTAKWLTI